MKKVTTPKAMMVLGDGQGKVIRFTNERGKSEMIAVLPEGVHDLGTASDDVDVSAQRGMLHRHETEERIDSSSRLTLRFRKGDRVVIRVADKEEGDLNHRSPAIALISSAAR